MFRKIVVVAVVATIIGVVVFGAVNRSLAQSENARTGQGGYGRGSSGVISAGQRGTSYASGQGNGGNGRGQGAGSSAAGAWTNLSSATPGQLSTEEAAALLYMREEEKLAHDVYVTLYAQWSLPIFRSISQSEQTHADAVKTLLDRYGLSDPASSVVGVFADPVLQTLYNDLVARGSESLSEALKVGAAIEEIDILDLESRIAKTDKADIQKVFDNLMKGSYNHLRAFVSTLTTQTGETYQPQYLSPDAYQVILDGSAGNPGGNGQGGNGQRGGRRGGTP